jgi:ribosomal protein S18 acetylase RimI-like enzyme
VSPRGGLLPDVSLDGLSVDDRAAMWRRSLARAGDHAMTTLVAEQGGQLAGFVLVGPCHDEQDGDDELGQVHALNVHPRAWRQGHGQALLAAGVDTLVDAGHVAVVLWVHPDNHRARRFYEVGRVASDEVVRQAEILGVEVAEVRYRRRLEGST